MSIRDMWLELRSELEGLWWVPLTGLLGPIPMIALACATDPMWASFLSPLPPFLASLRASRSEGSGPAIALGALLYLLLASFGFSSLYPSCYRLAHRELPSEVEGIPLLCGACSPSLTILLMLLMVSVVIVPFALPIPIAWLVACAYPAYVAFKRFRLVPRLLLIAYAAALLANTALLIPCATFYPPPPGEDSFVRSLWFLDSAASLLLAFACLWRARSGGGEKLLSLLTFYALVGTFR